MTFELNSLPDMFQSRIRLATCPIPNLAGDCWIWQTSLNQGGYGRVNWGGKPNRMAHKVVYELLVSAITDALEVDHLCRKHACVYPGHLELVTHKVNLSRGLGIGVHNAALVCCREGHPFNESNTYIWRGKRFCLRCQSRRQREYLERKRKKPLDIQIAAD